MPLCALDIVYLLNDDLLTRLYTIAFDAYIEYVENFLVYQNFFSIFEKLLRH